MPDAAPRWWAGTLLITREVLGEDKMPEPMPLIASSSANTRYGKSTGSANRPRKAPLRHPPMDPLVVAYAN